MYHKANKDNKYVRKALFESFEHKCAYCGDLVVPKNMHVDHILASNHSEKKDEHFDTYYSELLASGFIYDSLENFLPTCASCNLKKNNKNLTTANLRFFHQQALEHLNATLKQLDRARTMQIDFPFVDERSTSWEKIDFSYQRDISYAISQYRLGPADVCACPRFEQVEEIKAYLQQTDYVTVQGSPGCGKSITIFQAAYDYFKDGWTVFRFFNNSEYSGTLTLLEQSKSLYIVDDAQNIPKYLLQSLTDQARPNKKIIFGKTESTEYSRDCIIVTSIDAVRALKKNYSERILELTPIIHAHDKRVGEKAFDYPLEYRIEDAAKATTPWQFNYVLCGGWKTIRSQYLSVAGFHQCGLLCAAIAAFQIVQLDKPVDFRWIKTLYSNIDGSVNWSEEDLGLLIDKKIVLSLDDIRIVHLQSAYIVLSQFYKNSTDQERKVLQISIEAAYKQKQFPILGLVWMVNGTAPYFEGIYHTERFLSEKTLQYHLADLSTYNTPAERMHIAYLLSTTYRVSFAENEMYYIESNLEILAEWISNASDENAYAYSIVLNDLINHDKELYKRLTAIIDRDKLFESFAKAKPRSLFSWGKLINRLTYFVSSEDTNCYSNRLHTCCVEKFARINLRDLPSYSDFLCSIYHLSPQIASDLLLSHISDYETLWKTDITEIYEIFDFQFLSYLCGDCVLVRKKPTDTQKKVAKALVATLPPTEVAAFISHSHARHWRTIYQILNLVSKYSKHKVKEICNLVDLRSINQITESFWEKTNDDLFFLCCSIALGDLHKAEELLLTHEEKITHLCLPLVEISPKLAVELSKRGKQVSLVQNNWWGLTYSAIKLLIKEDCETADKIILDNSTCLSSELSTISVLDLDKPFLLKTLQLIGNNKHAALVAIVSQIDLPKLEGSIRRILSDSRVTKTIISRLHDLIKYLATYSADPQIFLNLNKLRRPRKQKTTY